MEKYKTKKNKEPYSSKAQGKSSHKPYFFYPKAWQSPHKRPFHQSSAPGRQKTAYIEIISKNPPDLRQIIPRIIQSLQNCNYLLLNHSEIIAK
jgi:hypothetical protein